MNWLERNLNEEDRRGPCRSTPHHQHTNLWDVLWMTMTFSRELIGSFYTLLSHIWSISWRFAVQYLLGNVWIDVCKKWTSFVTIKTVKINKYKYKYTIKKSYLANHKSCLQALLVSQHKLPWSLALWNQINWKMSHPSRNKPSLLGELALCSQVFSRNPQLK